MSWRTNQEKSIRLSFSKRVSNPDGKTPRIKLGEDWFFKWPNPRRVMKSMKDSFSIWWARISKCLKDSMDLDSFRPKRLLPLVLGLKFGLTSVMMIRKLCPSTKTCLKRLSKTVKFINMKGDEKKEYKKDDQTEQGKWNQLIY